MTMEELLVQAGRLPRIPPAAIAAYQQSSPVLTKYVDEKLCCMTDIHTLIGNNSMQVMLDNHANHAAFMETVFSLGNYALLCKTIPWVYHSYHSHHFSYDYFPVELRAWKEAIETSLDRDLMSPILTVYDWMLEHHESFIQLSQAELSSIHPANLDYLAVRATFQSALIAGDHHQCLEITLKQVQTPGQIEPYYSQVIQPVMYEIGRLWEQDDISVAQEHLASAIVGRILAGINMTLIESKKNKGKAVVTASPNEYHEIGAWMVADILENAGWHVQYLGANTPQKDLIKLLRSFLPDVLAISVSMPFNIGKTKAIIEEVRHDPELEHLKIMVGGKVFNENPDLWRTTGADGFAANLDEAIKCIQPWENPYAPC